MLEIWRFNESIFKIIDRSFSVNLMWCKMLSIGSKSALIEILWNDHHLRCLYVINVLKYLRKGLQVFFCNLRSGWINNNHSKRRIHLPLHTHPLLLKRAWRINYPIPRFQGNLDARVNFPRCRYKWSMNELTRHVILCWSPASPLFLPGSSHC